MRTSGILMHITSLPSPYGVGTMGSEAYKFVDFLKKAGQSYWQILPLTPTGYGDSPYQSCSTFAGNHYLIDLDRLVEDGLLTQADLEGIQWNVTDDKADFGPLHPGQGLHLLCGGEQQLAARLHPVHGAERQIRRQALVRVGA